MTKMKFACDLKTTILLIIVTLFLGLSLRLGSTTTLLDQVVLLAAGKTQQHQSWTVFNGTFTTLNDHYLSNAFSQDKKLPPSVEVLSLADCPRTPNAINNAIRLPNSIRNISFTIPGQQPDEERQYFNPTLIPLPPYSPYPYLLLSRLVTAGLHQESHICMATFCLPQNSTASKALPTDARHCDDSDENELGVAGGLRCATAPEKLNIPPTPAVRCEGAWSAFPDIPGFHDPRMFWSGKGEPLVIVNSGSMYGCVGLWIIDIRAVHPRLHDLLARKGEFVGLASKEKVMGMSIPAPMSYPYLTELTKNPRDSRSDVEKNWILFFPKAEQAWIQYDMVTHAHRVEDEEQHAMTSLDIGNMLAVFDSDHEFASTDGQSRGNSVNSKRSNANRAISAPTLAPARTIAKLIGSGHTTPNLTASNEAPCLTSADLLDQTGRLGHWHQGSNSLRLILCSRHDQACMSNHSDDQLIGDGKVVHFAVLHRKFSNDMDLPMRYERYFMVWEARPPFRMVGISSHPILFLGEKASPWIDVDGDIASSDKAGRWSGAYFTYTPSIAWAWRRDVMVDEAGGARVSYGTGYLDDEVIIGIGMDDTAQGVVRVRADELLGCLRFCPDFEEFSQRRPDQSSV